MGENDETLICVECGLIEPECACKLGFKGITPERRERLLNFIKKRKIMEIPWIKEYNEDIRESK